MADVFAWIFIACCLGLLASIVGATTDFIYDTYNRWKNYIAWRKKYNKRRNRWI